MKSIENRSRKILAVFFLATLFSLFLLTNKRPSYAQKITPIPTLTSEEELQEIVREQKIDSFWIGNSLKTGIRKAVNNGVSLNTIILILLFPMTAALIAFSRNIVGLKGFGFFTPAIVSVAFLSTGFLGGIILLLTILIMATLTRLLIRQLKLLYLPYWPRMAIIIWAVSLSVLGLLFFASSSSFESLNNLGIFPILLFILLAETFIDAQITRTNKEVNIMVIETIILAIINYLLMSSVSIQKTVIFHPEATIIIILVIDFLIARYKGLRLTEAWRFRDLLDK